MLDVLAEYRHHLTLPCTSVNLGLLGDYAGLANSRNDTRGVASSLVKQGLLKMPLHTVQGQLELAMLHKIPSRVTAILDWAKLKGSFSAISADSRFSDIINNTSENTEGKICSRLKDKIASAKDAFKAAEILTREIALLFSKILSVSENNIAVDQPIDKFGFDSLSYIQVRTWIFKNLDINYPVIKLMSSFSIRGLAEELMDSLKFFTDS